MKNTFLQFILLLITPLTSVLAQPNWDYTTAIATNEIEYGTAIAVDPINNWVYVVGTFHEAISFGLIPAVMNGGADNGKKDGFLAKYSPAGVLQWVVSMGGSQDDQALGVAVGPQGGIYVTGYCEGTAFFNSAAAPAVNILGLGGTDIFIAKYFPTGVLDWVNVEGGASDDYGHSIASSGSALYVAGVYDGFPNFSGITPEATFSNTVNTFLAKYDYATGTAQWLFEAKTSGEDNYGLINPELFKMDVTTHDDSVYFTSYMGGTTMRFVDGAGTLLSTELHTDLNSAGQDHVITAVNSNGGFIWSQRIDNISSSNQLGTGITADCAGVYVCGTLHDGAILPSNPTTTVSLFNHDKPYIMKLNHGDGVMDWSKTFNSNGPDHINNFSDISADQFGNLFVIGTIISTSFSNSDTTLNAGATSRVAVFKYHNDSDFEWARLSNGVNGDDQGFGIATAGNQFVYITGRYNDDFGIGSTVAGGSTVENDNFFLSRLTASGNVLANICQCLGPEITACQADTSVTADVNCEYSVGDLSVGLTLIDHCGNGFSTSQSPVLGTILPPGIHEIQLVVTDIIGLSDTCYFELTVLADVNPTVVSCGQTLLNETTFGGNNTVNDFSCVGFSTPGEDVYYQIDVPAGNYWINVMLENVSDIDDSHAQVFWIGGSCPLGGGCLDNESLDISTGLFTNGSNSWQIQATGPGTYYIAIDGIQVNGIDSYDISFNCYEFGIEFDESCGTSTGDLDGNGVITSINGTTALSVQPCEIVTVCNEFIIANNASGEWLDSVHMTLDPCYTNITNITPNGINGWYNSDGNWIGNYDTPTNSISWDFSNSITSLGDGTGSNYSCALGGQNDLYNFCFDTEISSACLDTDLGIAIVISDDGDNSLAGSVPNSDALFINDITLYTSDPTFTYPSIEFCKGQSNVTASVNLTGGIFSAPVGIDFVNTSTGEINLTTSFPGAYPITYSVGPCPSTSVFNIVIYEMQDPSFDYSAVSYCNSAVDPIANISGTQGGTFSGPSEIFFSDSFLGKIDLSLSTVGGPYSIQYKTSGPNCPDSSTFEVSIIQTDDASFSYLKTDYCISDENPNAINIVTPNGTFTSSDPIEISNSLNGEINLSGSLSGGPYNIKYTTTGVCPDSSEIGITIHDALTSNAGQDQAFNFIFEAVLNANIPVNASGKWSNMNYTFDDDTDPFTTVRGLKVGTNAITWTVSNDYCPSVSDIMFIEVRDLWIPDALTPNGDYDNDLFALDNIDYVKCSLEIFNRWGQKVYTNPNYENNWEGTNMDGAELPNDTYFYLITINDEFDYHGYVVIKR